MTKFRKRRERVLDLSIGIDQIKMISAVKPMDILEQQR
jgi:hypothetical protein